ncbi:c-type cytochrome [Hydrogenobacter hydrogenophilus]|uniref:Cytochrome c n=1 Tax=Hydrogenobacter hydrogenophilus TaxID=35835 RepID=A0A285P4L1_9AQUI|nr:cytochrome C [Hydrogenobacter hydrogenophilus]SNZ16672.1 cytochrome c [Hydrogenobacter hydrogenophilus]
MWLFLVFFLLSSCEKAKLEEKPRAEISTKELFKLRGCTYCHDTSRPLVGPAFLDVAMRYKENEKEDLVKSILEGSCGKWKGKWECMPPQRVGKEEARRMVEWILHLKTTKPPASSL